MTTVPKQHRNDATPARPPHRTRASFTSMATGLIKLSPDFVEAVRAVAPRTRRRKLPFVLAAAALVFVAWGVFTPNGRQWFGAAARRIWEGTHVSEAAASTGTTARSASIAPASIPIALPAAPMPDPTPAPTTATMTVPNETVANAPAGGAVAPAQAAGAAQPPPGSTAAVRTPSKSKPTRKQQHRRTPR
jgi:hypothetical protein